MAATVLGVLQRSSRNSVLVESNQALVQRIETLKDQREDDRLECKEDIAKRDVAIAHLEGQVQQLESGLADRVAEKVARGVAQALREEGVINGRH